MKKNAAMMLGDVVDADAYVGISHFLKKHDFVVHAFSVNAERIKTHQGSEITLESLATEKLNDAVDVVFILAASEQEQKSILNQQAAINTIFDAIINKKLIVTLDSAKQLIADLEVLLNLPAHVSLVEQVFSLSDSAQANQESNTMTLHQIKMMLQAK